MAFHRREASMRCTSLDMPLLDETLGLSIAGKARTGITRAFLRKKALGGGLVPDATAEHVKLEVAEGRINPQEFGGDHQGQATLGLQVTPTYDGVNAPITYVKNVAVSGA
ncbi:hypothetical protein AMJ85_10710 [candidate division BRC1 bacterium SM23_51]|nr:MAG: hypothetical protein AMJ85_10710 [candidate division BRC1 bacterium SM23_51]